MAITILQSPETKSPVFNPIWYLLSSTNTAQANFRYICDVYITGITPSYFRIKTPPDPTYSRGAFDVARIIEAYTNTALDLDNHGFYQNTTSARTYTAKFGEEYGPTSGIVAYPDLTVDTSKVAFHGGLRLLDFKDWLASDYVLTTASTTKKFLTNRVSSGVIDLDENAWLFNLQQTNGAATFLTVKCYDSAGALIQTRKIINDYTDASTDANILLRCSAGPNNLNLVAAGNISGGGQPVVPTNTAKYSCYVENASAQTSETQWFVIKDLCEKYTKYRLHFLNVYGGFDSYSFIGGSRKTTSIKKSNYSKQLGRVLTGTTYGFNKRDRFSNQFNTESKDRIRINTDWITETEATWLKELLTSPEVYLDDSTDGLLAINILDVNYEERQHVTNKAFNLSVEFEYSHSEYRQKI